MGVKYLKGKAEYIYSKIKLYGLWAHWLS